MIIRPRLLAAVVCSLIATHATAETYAVKTSPKAFEDLLPTTINRPVSIYFAIDVTGSMAGNIAAIQTNVELFADNMRAQGFDLMLGGVGFRDEITPSDTLSLTADVDVFKAYIRRLVARDGGDGAEASLLAVQESVNRLQREETRPNALKVVLVIGDQPGHYGVAGSPRDCKVDALAATFNAIPEPEHINYRIFYSVAAGGNSDCGETLDATTQMERLIAAIFPTSAAADRGASVTYPFTGQSLLIDLTRLIQIASPGTEWGNCFASRARLESQAGATVHEWTEAEIDTYLANRQVAPLTTTLTQDQFNSLGGAGKVIAEYCCMELGEWPAPDFRDHCVVTQNRNIDLTVTTVAP